MQGLRQQLQELKHLFTITKSSMLTDMYASNIQMILSKNNNKRELKIFERKPPQKREILQMKTSLT